MASFNLDFGPPADLAGAPMVLSDSFDTLLRRNTANSIKETQAAQQPQWQVEDIKVVKNARTGTQEVPVVDQNFQNAEFWKFVGANPEYAKEIYRNVKLAAGDSRNAPFVINAGMPDGGMITGSINSDGTSSIMTVAKPQVDAIKQTNETVAAGQQANSALQELISATNIRVSAVDRANIETKSKQDAAIAAITKSNTALDSMFSTQADMLNATANSMLLGGEAKVARAEAQNAALQNIAGSNAVKSLFERTAAQSLDLFDKEKKAQENLDRVLANPFFGAASYLAGGEDKNPIVQGAKNTVKQIQDARAAAIQNSNQLLLGLGQMQGIINNEYSVARPNEIRADAAKAAAEFRVAAVNSQVKQAGLPVDLAKQAAIYADAGYKDTLSAAQLELNSKQAALNGTNGLERLVLQEQLLGLKKYIADQSNDTKQDALAAREASGSASTEVSARIGTKYGLVSGLPAGSTDKEINKNLIMGAKIKDRKLDLVKLLDAGGAGPSGNSVHKWQTLVTELPGTPLLGQAYPELVTSITPQENGFSRWQQMNQLQEEVVQTTAKAKGEKFNEKGDRPIAEAAAQKAIVLSQLRPEEPVAATVNGKEVKLAAANPWKVYPGVMLAPGDNNDSGLPDTVKASFAKENKVAQKLAVYEAKNKLIPKSSAAVKTVDWQDGYIAALEVRTENPELDPKQIARWFADIYEAGVGLNNKDLAPKSFGLPEQKGYIVNMQQAGYGAAAMKRLSTGASTMGSAIVTGVTRLPPEVIERAQTTLGTNVAANARKNEFFSEFQDPFYGLVETTQVDLTNPTQILNSWMRANPGVWSSAKK